MLTMLLALLLSPQSGGLRVHSINLTRAPVTAISEGRECVVPGWAPGRKPVFCALTPPNMTATIFTVHQGHSAVTLNPSHFSGSLACIIFYDSGPVAMRCTDAYREIDAAVAARG